MNNCQAPGQGPVSSPLSRSKSELHNSKFSVKFSTERTWRDTIIKQATPPYLRLCHCISPAVPPTNKLFEALTIAYMMLVRSSTLTDVKKNFDKFSKYFFKNFLNIFFKKFPNIFFKKFRIIIN